MGIDIDIKVKCGRSGHYLRLIITYLLEKFWRRIGDEKMKALPLTSLSKQLDKQNTRIIKVMQMLEPVQRQIRTTKKQPALIKQIQSQ